MILDYVCAYISGEWCEKQAYGVLNKSKILIETISLSYVHKLIRAHATNDFSYSHTHQVGHLWVWISVGLTCWTVKMFRISLRIVVMRNFWDKLLIVCQPNVLYLFIVCCHFFCVVRVLSYSRTSKYLSLGVFDKA